jgi:MDMPI C-terminal domain
MILRTQPRSRVDLILDPLDQVAGRTGKTEPGPLDVAVVTSDPVRTLRLSVSDAVTLSPASPPDGGASGAILRLPAEALIRLVYGRLDPAHTPAAVAAEGVDLNTLRAVFPGF